MNQEESKIKKENYVTLVLSIIGLLLLGIGMCMAMVWSAMNPGIVVGLVGMAVLIIMVFIRRRMVGTPPIQLNAKAIFTVLLGIVGALVLGTGMCMVMVLSMLVPGVVVGLIGLVLLLALIPLVKGLK